MALKLPFQIRLGWNVSLQSHMFVSNILFKPFKRPSMLMNKQQFQWLGFQRVFVLSLAPNNLVQNTGCDTATCLLGGGSGGRKRVRKCWLLFPQMWVVNWRRKQFQRVVKEMYRMIKLCGSLSLWLLPALAMLNPLNIQSTLEEALVTFVYPWTNHYSGT